MTDYPPMVIRAENIEDQGPSFYQRMQAQMMRAVIEKQIAELALITGEEFAREAFRPTAFENYH